MRLRDAVVAHLVVFLGVLLHHFLLFAHLFLQLAVLVFQLVDDAEFPSDESFGYRSLNVISGMNRLEELLKESLEVAFIEVLHSFLVLDVGLRLLQCLVDGLPVIEALGEGHDFRSHEDVATGDGFLQLDAVE